MPYSRLGRYEQKKQMKRLAWTIGGSITILVLLALFGLKMLEGFSLLVGKFKSNSFTPETQNTLLLPPTLDDTYEATNTATIKLSGRGEPKLTILVYINEEEKENQTVEDDGTFSIDTVTLKEGSNTISVKAKDDKGNTSELSNILNILYRKRGPILELESPSENASIIGEKNAVLVAGNTDEDATLTVNGRVVVIHAGGSFSYDSPLQEGSNAIHIVATDTAGNQTTIDRTVTYHK